MRRARGWCGPRRGYGSGSIPRAAMSWFIRSWMLLWPVAQTVTVFSGMSGPPRPLDHTWWTSLIYEAGTWLVWTSQGLRVWEHSPGGNELVHQVVDVVVAGGADRHGVLRDVRPAAALGPHVVDLVD